MSYPGRLSLLEGRVYFPSRVGFPADQGTDELWVVERGADPRRVAQAGRLWGITATPEGVFVASYGNRIEEFAPETGLAREGFDVPGGLVTQITANASTLFATILASDTGPAQLVAVDLDTRQAGPIWTSPLVGAPLWLRATESELVLTVNDGELTAGYVYHVDLSTKTATELPATIGEVGGADVRDGVVWFAAQDEGYLGRYELATGSLQKFALPGVWAVLIDGDYVYVSVRPDYCMAPAEGSVQRLPIDGGNLEVVATDLLCPSQLVADAAGLYWVNNGTWSGLSEDAASVNGSVTFLPRAQ